MSKARRGIPRRFGASVLVFVALAFALTACGNRLSYGRVLAENVRASGITAERLTNAQGSEGNTSTTAAQSNTTTTIASGSTSSGIGAVGSGTLGAETTPTLANKDASAGSSAAASNGPATGSPVAVGQIGTNSGLVGSILGSGQTGAEIWAKWANQHGGLNGHKIDLITADDGGNPSTGLSDAQTMVEQDHVIAFVGSDNVLSEPAVANYLDSVNVPTIAGDDVVSQWFTNSDFFPTGSSIRVIVDSGIETAVNEGDTKVALVACVEFALICSNIESIVTHDIGQLGAQIVYNASVSIAQPDFTSVCLGAQAAGANQVSLYMDPASMVRFANDCAAQNYHPVYVTGTIGWNSTILSTPNLVGMVATGPVFPFPEVAPATAQFDQATQQATGGPPTSELEASAWVGGLILQAASKDLPASNPTAAEVLAGLYQIKNDTFGGLTSPLTYTPGQPTTSSTCYFSMKVAQTGFTAPDGMQTQCMPASFAPYLSQ